MRKSAKKALILMVGVIMAVTLFLGCEEENVSDTKSSATRSKFIAAENRRLRNKIESLKQEHEKELKRQEKLLAKCLRQREALAEQGIKDLMETALMDNALKDAPEEMVKLYEENKSLKLQIDKLQKENSNLKGQITRLKKELEELTKRPTITS